MEGGKQINSYHLCALVKAPVTFKLKFSNPETTDVNNFFFLIGMCKGLRDILHFPSKHSLSLHILPR